MSLLRRVIGGVLRRVRLRQGRTLREVALAAGVSLPYLSEVERGRKEASSEVLAAICRALGINLSDLLEEARDELRRVERRVPATSGVSLARLERVPVARGDGGSPHLQVGSYTGGPLLRPGASSRHAAGSTLLAGGSVGGGMLHVGSSIGGTGLRVRLIAPAPAGRPRPRRSTALARRRARAGRRRLTVA